MDLLNGDSRHLRPGLIGVRIVVEKLVAEHQGNSQESILAARLALYARVGLLQLPHEQKGKKDDVLGDLGRGQNCCYPFAESGSWYRVWYERL